MNKRNPIELGAAEAAEAIRKGVITSVELVQACLERIDQVEEKVQAWVHLDSDLALDRAREADEARQAGKTLGALHAETKLSL